MYHYLNRKRLTLNYFLKYLEHYLLMGHSRNKIHPESNIGDLKDFYKKIESENENLTNYINENTEYF